MPNPQNLEGKGFKPGQSGNPNGRPKGSKNRSTIVKKWLGAKMKFKNPMKGGKETNGSVEDYLTLTMINVAKGGNVQAYRELMDSAYGKARQEVDVTSDGESIVAPPTELDLSKLSDEELEMIVKLKRKHNVERL